MGQFKIYDPSIPASDIAREREQAYLRLSPVEKWHQLRALIRLSVTLNGGQPLKKPQGKGLVLYRKH